MFNCFISGLTFTQELYLKVQCVVYVFMGV